MYIHITCKYTIYLSIIVTLAVHLIQGLSSSPEPCTKTPGSSEDQDVSLPGKGLDFYDVPQGSRDWALIPRTRGSSVDPVPGLQKIQTQASKAWEWTFGYGIQGSRGVEGYNPLVQPSYPSPRRRSWTQRSASPPFISSWPCLCQRLR